MAIKFLNSVAVDTDVLFVDTANERVGIGTTSPGAKLDIYGESVSTNRYSLQTFSSTGQPVISIYNSNSDATPVPRIVGTNSYINLYNGVTVRKTAGSGNILTVNDPSNSAKFIVDASGNVGIGTTSPTAKLHVSSDSGGTLSEVAHFVGGGSIDDKSQISVGGNTSSALVSFGFRNTGSGFGYIANASDTEIITIDGGNERVGIGTTAPGYPLHVKNTSGANYIKIESPTSTNSGIIFSDGANRALLAVDVSDSMLFYTGGINERMRITDAGNVGIGTTSPGAKLEVAGDMNLYNPSLTSQINFRNIGDGNYIKSNGYSTHFGLRGNTGSGVFIIENSLASTQDIRIKPTTSGWDFSSRGVAGVNALLTIDSVLNISNKTNVGIGTTSPSEKLEVAGNIVINGSSDSADGLHLKDRTFVAFSDAGSVVSRFRSSASGVFQFQDGSYNTNVVLNNNGNSYLNGGNVGIGTTAPSTSLHVKSTSAGSGYMTIENTVHYSKLDLKSTTYTGSIIMDGTGGYISGGGLILNSGTNVRTQFLQGGVAKMIINNGNVGIGTTSPALQSGGTGLHINATANSEIKFTNSTTGTTASDGTALVASGAGFTINNREAGNLSLGTSNSVRMLINSAGNVGIGTTSPSQKLEVDGQVLSDGYRLAAMQTAPAARNSTGTLGEIVIDGNHMYVCYATNSWSRVALATSW